MHPGYEHRRSQLEMAEMVEEAFQKHQHALIEAGTGTGKTLAYLIPAIRSGRRVVISTATKSLQEQLFEKDIPFLQKHFAPESESGGDERAAAISCAARKFIAWRDQPVLKGMDEARLVRADSRLGKTDGDGRPRGAEFSAGRRRAVERASTRAGTRARDRNARSSTLLPHGDAPARRRSRRDHREPSFVFCGSGAAAGRFRQRFCRNTRR